MADTWRDYRHKVNGMYYIAGLISDTKDYPERFAKGKQELAKLGKVGISPLEICDGSKMSWAECMRTDITVMIHCRGVYALRDWKCSKGANIEVQLALRLGLEVIFQDDREEIII